MGSDSLLFLQLHLLPALCGLFSSHLLPHPTSMTTSLPQFQSEFAPVVWTTLQLLPFVSWPSFLVPVILVFLHFSGSSSVAHQPLLRKMFTITLPSPFFFWLFTMASLGPDQECFKDSPAQVFKTSSHLREKRNPSKWIILRSLLRLNKGVGKSALRL